MPAFPTRIRTAVVAVSAIALLTIAAGGAFAASNPPTLYACFDVYGNVRLSDKNMCQLPAGGRLVSFNTIGIQGPTGPIGATGPTGATGPNAITAGTACTTDTYTATIGFDDHGYPHCGVLLTVALGQGGLEGMTASTFTASVNYIVLSASATTPASTTAAGCPTTTTFPAPRSSCPPCRAPWWSRDSTRTARSISGA